MPTFRPHRLLVVGAERVGKTALIEQFIFGNHVVGQRGLPTVGDTYEVCVETDKGTPEKLFIYDTPGQLFTSSSSSLSEQDHFLSIADGVLLVYDVTTKASFEVVVALRQRIALRNKDIPIIALANKSDLGPQREVDCMTVALPWARSHALRLFEVSVLDRDTLKEPLCYMAWRMANPGRQLAQIPSLSSMPPSSASDRHHHSSDLSPTSGQLDKDEPDSPFSSQASGSSRMLSSRPEDAHYPKHPALLFADCLSTKGRQHAEGRY